MKMTALREHKPVGGHRASRRNSEEPQHSLQHAAQMPIHPTPRRGSMAKMWGHIFPMTSRADSPILNISATVLPVRSPWHQLTFKTNSQKITFKEQNIQLTYRRLSCFKWLKCFLMKIWISSRLSKIKPEKAGCFYRLSIPSFIRELNISYSGAVCEAPEMPPKFILKLQILFLKTTMIKHDIYRCLLFSKAAIWEKSKP